MTFFDCVYLRVSKFYASAEKEKLNGINGLVVVALMQSVNILTIFLTVCIILVLKFPFPPFSLLLLYIVLFFANGVRYYNIDFQELQRKWDANNEKKQYLLTQLVRLYIIFSSIVCFSLVLYVANKKYLQ